MIAAGRGIIGDDGVQEYVALKIFFKGEGAYLAIKHIEGLKKKSDMNEQRKKTFERRKEE